LTPAAAVLAAAATALANEGVLLRAGGDAVIVDALFREGIRGYASLPAGERQALEEGRAPYDGVGVALATHAHADHFDPEAVRAWLAAHPDGHFVSTPQAVARLRGAGGPRARGLLPAAGAREVLALGKARVTVFNLHHGEGQPVSNLGFLVELGGRRFLHVGDTEVTAAELRPLHLESARIDLALLPFWTLLGPEAGAIQEAIGARAVAAVHVPAPDAPADYFGPPGSLEGLRAALSRRWPAALLAYPPGTVLPLAAPASAVQRNTRSSRSGMASGATGGENR
jgi:L-ascorbate metabolism protein UlaG (beta-lactamase superfamily)